MISISIVCNLDASASISRVSTTISGSSRAVVPPHFELVVAHVFQLQLGVALVSIDLTVCHCGAGRATCHRGSFVVSATMTIAVLSNKGTVTVALVYKKPFVPWSIQSICLSWLTLRLIRCWDLPHNSRRNLWHPNQWSMTRCLNHSPQLLLSW